MNSSEVSIVKEGQEYDNLILPLPGGSRVHKILKRELILDDITIKGFLYYIDISVRISVDYEKTLITIDTVD